MTLKQCIVYEKPEEIKNLPDGTKLRATPYNTLSESYLIKIGNNLYFDERELYNSDEEYSKDFVNAIFAIDETLTDIFYVIESEIAYFAITK